jgi:ribosomal protein L40E
MVYCHKCGTPLPENAFFCPKCGSETVQGVQTDASSSDQMREAFTRMSQEMEKAFTIAAKEIQEAFQTARSNIQKTVYKEPVICSNCGEKNLSNATYCTKCGKTLSSLQTSE